MLVVSDLSKRFPGAESHILQNISFIVNAGERVGLIGPNGSGKSTLLQIIAGEIMPDSGSVQHSPSSVRVGYLAQGVVVDETQTVEAVLLPQAQALRAAESDVARLAEAVAAGAASAESAYDAALARLVDLSMVVDSGIQQKALHHLGLSGVTLDTPVRALSGGQKTRLMLVAILVSQPDLLLLDEPTNHLDVEALAWLEDWLLDFRGGVLIVSHDRAFLDRVVNCVVALDPETATCRVFAGGYSDYVATIRVERDRQWSEWKDQEVEIARLKWDASRMMARAVRKENATQNDHQRQLAKKVAHKAKAKETRLRRYLESDERVEKPKPTWDVKMDFGEIAPIRSAAVELVDVSVGYDSPLLAGLSLTVRSRERIAIMGPNGHGKTTLLRTIIGELPPLSGTVQIGGSVRTGYLAQEQDVLDPALCAVETIQREARMDHTEARSFLHFFLFSGDDGLRPVGALSYGERTRLMLARLVARGANLLVLDEPLNHLDLPSREKFEQALSNYPGSVLAIVHDRYFVDRFAHTIWHVAGGQLAVEVREVEIV